MRTLTRQGKAFPECAIKTRKGTKVADVVWVSQERFEKIKHETECSVAPEICVEILSSSNTEDEINEKRNLYFENGAKEVWTCSKNGNIIYYSTKGMLDSSLLVPEFPARVII